MKEGLVFHKALPFSEGDGERQLACAVSCSVKPGVLDLETGAGAGLGAFNDYYIPTGEAGLFPAAGEILLSGVMEGETVRQFYKKGEERIIEKTFEACESFVRSGLLVGHNVLGFDLPFLAARARIKGVPVPEWVTGGGGVFDTYRMFVKRGRFATGMLSLQETAALWGRKPDGESGAMFGDLWRGGTDEQRAELRVYNILNLIDSLALAVHSGKLGRPIGFTEAPHIAAKPWGGSEGFSWAADAVPEARGETVFFQWLTSPLEGLWEKGPRVMAGWGRTRDEDTRRDYPKGPGRLDAGASRIVGFVSSDKRVLNVADEAGVISDGLAVLKRLVEDNGAVYTEAPGQSRNFLCLRSSIYGGILPGWTWEDGKLKDDRVKGLGDGFLRGLSKSLGGVDVRIPVYTGGQDDYFLEVAARVSLHRSANAEKTLVSGS